MTIRTQRLCAFEDETIVLSFDWEDTDGTVRVARCVNTSPRYAVHIVVEGLGSGAAGRGFEQTIAADSGLTEVSIPVGQRPAYPVIVDPEEPEGVSILGWEMRAEIIG